MKGSGTPKGPVRLRIGYKTPQSLLAELTKSVGRGGVRIESRKTLPAGTKFLFELRVQGIKEAVEVHGTVLTVSESAPGKYVLHIRYEPPTSSKGLDAVIARIFQTPDMKRRHPRVPLHVRAVEERPGSPNYRVRDISRGGVGIDVEGDRMPKHVTAGTPFLMQMKLSVGMVKLHGEVVWVVDPAGEVGPPPRFGVAWGKLQPKMGDYLDALIAFRALPAPPWIARLSFGADAAAGQPAK